ncbi:hypothetical protein [Anaeromyxobacter dehalogenans]|nr:hypothetical protein [Anaeromyxobacter dehalogenans]
MVQVQTDPAIVYCDMSGGAWTYEAFGFGPLAPHVAALPSPLDAPFPGYERVQIAEFSSSPALRAAFVLHYDRLGGIPNLTQGWQSSNCCFAGADQYSVYWYAFGEGNTWMFPVHADGSAACNQGYSDPVIKLQVGGPDNSYPTKTSLTQADLASPVLLRNCGLGDNPAIYVKKYQ